MTIESSSFWVGPPTEPDTYQLINTLGTGGEGQVWRAVVPLSDAGRRQVAVKILSSSNWMSEQEWSRFGHLLKSLSHPGLVRVSEVFAGTVMHRYQQAPPPGALRYVVMDFVDGVTLTEWLAENPDATVAARIAMLRTVAAALDEMHSGRTTEVPVAHGDVKPANIILKPDGGTVLVDLGLARLSDAAGVSGRTNPYAAPELHADGAQATPESDAFAFCATLGHLLIGQPPPLDANGIPDLQALSNLLTTNPLTQRRPALVRQIMIALAARADLRPKRLSDWIGATGDTVSQVTSNASPAAPFGPPPVPPPPFEPDAGPSLPTPTPNPPPSKPRPATTGTKRRGALVSILAVLGVVLAAVTYAVGAVTHPSWAAEINPIPAPPAATSTQTVAGTTATVTETVFSSTSPMPGPTPSPVPGPTPTSTPSPIPGPVQTKYLLDLDWKSFQTNPSSITPGLAIMTGTRYEHSFVAGGCIPVNVLLPASGFTELSGITGFPGNSPSNGSGIVTVIISQTRDRITNNNSPVWTVVDQIPLSRDAGTPFSEQLPSGVTAIQLSVSRDNCETVVWGDPQVA